MVANRLFLFVSPVSFQICFWAQAFLLLSTALPLLWWVLVKRFAAFDACSFRLHSFAAVATVVDRVEPSALRVRGVQLRGQVKRVRRTSTWRSSLAHHASPPNSRCTAPAR